MTAAVLSAGDGYMYYTNSIATGDISRETGRPLTDYYTADGNPPGVWVGAGAPLLGVSDEVTEAQMKALFGEGLHPDADAISEHMRAEGRPESEIAEAIKLGRAYYKYDVKDTALKTRIYTAYREHERLHGAEPTREERRQISMRESAIVFRDVHGRPHTSSEELARYVTAAMKPAQTAVAGFDLTFSPPKSVSVLWALAERDTSAAIVAAHEAAIADTIGYLEREAIATRAGVNGVRQIDVAGGLVATRFRHHESRTGDPHIHDHVVVANKVKGTDGVWRSLDSRLLLRMKVAASEVYNSRLFDHLQGAGLGATARVVTPGKPVVLEVAGVSEKLIGLFSTRSRGIKKVTDQLVKEYIKDHGRAPDNTALIKLSAEAWQRTRPLKDKPRSIATLRQDVRRTVHREASYHDADLIGQTARKQAPRVELADAARPPLELHQVAAQVMANVEQARSTWGEHHVKAEITRWLSAHRYRRLTLTEAGTNRPVDRTEAAEFLLRTTLQLDSVKVTPGHVHARFQPLTRTSDGESFYVSKGRTLYTSTRILEAEHRLLTAARTTSPQAAAVTPAQFAAALAANPNRDAAQVALAREFVTSRTQLVVGIGPAGAGKTRSMRLAAAAVHQSGHRMIGLTQSKNAAVVFRDAVHVPAFTIDAFLTAHRAAAISGEPVAKNYRIHPGDVVVVDEAAMGATRSLDDVTTTVLAAGGYVRFVGDTSQIAAVGAGGAMRLIANEVGALQLQTLYRFTNPDEAAASLVLRDAPAGVDPFAWYKANGRIIAGTRDKIAGLVFADYLRDLDAGKEAVMIAPIRELIDELNTRAQAHAIATGVVTGGRSVQLSDGRQAHRGDQVMTRYNSRTLTMNGGQHSVANGDLYTVLQAHRDGSLTVRNNAHAGTIRLPSDYVKGHTHLGYAFTAHQKQGDTTGGTTPAGQRIDGVGRGVVDATTTRASAYVQSTRATTENHLYVIVESGQHPDEVLAQIAENVDTNLSAHEMVDVESERVLELGRLVNEHADIVALANQKRFEGLAGRVLGADHARTLTGSLGWDAVAAGLARAERHGVDVDKLLLGSWQQRDFTGAEDIGLVMSSRIEGNLAGMVEAGTADPLPEPGLDTGRYEWAVDRDAALHPDLPEEWREHLAERAAYLDARMIARATALTLERPEWTRQLGEVPADRARQAQWMRLAAEVELFRSLYNIDPAHPDPIPVKYREQEGQTLGRNLAARVVELHKSTAIRDKAGTFIPASPEQLQTQAVKKLTDVDTRRPVADAEKIVKGLDPERRSALMKEIEKLRQDAELLAEKARTRAPIDPAPTEQTVSRSDQPNPDAVRPQRGPRIG